MTRINREMVQIFFSSSQICAASMASSVVFFVLFGFNCVRWPLQTKTGRGWFYLHHACIGQWSSHKKSQFLLLLEKGIVRPIVCINDIDLLLISSPIVRQNTPAMHVIGI